MNSTTSRHLLLVSCFLAAGCAPVDRTPGSDPLGDDGAATPESSLEQMPLDFAPQEDGSACGERTVEDDDGSCVPVIAAEPELLATSVVDDELAAFGATSPLAGVPTEDSFGVVAKKGALRARTSSILKGTLNVRKDRWGWSADRDTVDRWFANRTELSPGLIALDQGRASGTLLMLLDPSCDTVCAGSGELEPTNVWRKRAADLPASYLTPGSNGDFLLRFRIKSARIDTNKWVNSFALFNNTKKAFAVIHSHTFRATQKDCSVDNTCGKNLYSAGDYMPSGPSIASDPTKATLAARGLGMTNDGAASLLTFENTSFRAPKYNWTIAPRSSNTTILATHR